MTIKKIEAPMDWSPVVEAPMQHVNLTETIESVLRGIAQAERGEESELDPSKLPTDDDE